MTLCTHTLTGRRACGFPRYLCSAPCPSSWRGKHPGNRFVPGAEMSQRSHLPSLLFMSQPHLSQSGSFSSTQTVFIWFQKAKQPLLLWVEPGPLRLSPSVQEVSPGKDAFSAQLLAPWGSGNSAFQWRSEFGCLVSVNLLIFAHGSFQDLFMGCGCPLSFVPEVSLAGSVSRGDKGAMLAFMLGSLPPYPRFSSRGNCPS